MEVFVSHQPTEGSRTVRGSELPRYYPNPDSEVIGSGSRGALDCLIWCGGVRAVRNSPIPASALRVLVASSSIDKAFTSLRSRSYAVAPREGHGIQHLQSFPFEQARVGAASQVWGLVHPIWSLSSTLYNPNPLIPGVMDPNNSATTGGTPAPYGRACTNCARAKCRCIYRSEGTDCER